MATKPEASPADGGDDSAFDQLMVVAHEYELRFGRSVPDLAMVSDSAIRREALKTLKRGRPISNRHNGYRHLPPGAYACVGIANP